MIQITELTPTRIVGLKNSCIFFSVVRAPCGCCSGCVRLLFGLSSAVIRNALRMLPGCVRVHMEIEILSQPKTIQRVGDIPPLKWSHESRIATDINTKFLPDSSPAVGLCRVTRPSPWASICRPSRAEARATSRTLRPCRFGINIARSLAAA